MPHPLTSRRAPAGRRPRQGYRQPRAPRWPFSWLSSFAPCLTTCHLDGSKLLLFGRPRRRLRRVAEIADGRRVGHRPITILSVLSGTPSTILVTAWGPSPGTSGSIPPRGILLSWATNHQNFRSPRDLGPPRALLRGTAPSSPARATRSARPARWSPVAVQQN